MDNCIAKFLMNYNQGNIEGHSDSSDFDETLIVPRVSVKGGKHSLLDKTYPMSKWPVSELTFKRPANNQYMHTNSIKDENIPERDYNINIQHERKKNHKTEINTLNNKGDKVSEQQTINNITDAQHKTIPCFSSMSKRSNYTKQISTPKDIPQNNLINGKSLCVDCERRRKKKLNRRRPCYVVQPVCAVDNIQGTCIYEGRAPFGRANDPAPLQHMRKQESKTSYELTSSESDIGNTNQRKNVSHRRNFIDRFQKEMRKEYIKYEKELIRNRIQQYPSKRYYNFPNDEFDSPYSQVIDANTVGEGDQSNIPSTSTGFWEYLFEKIRGKRFPEKDAISKTCCRKEKVTRASVTPPPQIQPPQQHISYEDIPEENTCTEQQDDVPECHSCLQQTEDRKGNRMEGMPNKVYLNKSSSQHGKNKLPCKCNSIKKRKQSVDEKNSLKLLPQRDDVTRPCQKPHDDVIRTVEEKYNGEILCIHNPPCILINGCLNLPASELSPVQGTYWPVTQGKKSSFYQLCRKIKRPKNNCEQACQYHPPSIEVQRAMQIKSEKVVQSICNHDPPCEIVYGCYKPKYDPKLDNSCVHVPMCQRLPECSIGDRKEELNEDTKKGVKCEHKPKCTELPLCSRKFIVLTAKGTVGTQVRPKSKMVCRHEPPCIMIPKCLARIISDGYMEAIPDCVHQPCCELIPACCGKAAKETVRLTSVEDGISLKLARPPLSHKNRILQAMLRTQKTK